MYVCCLCVYMHVCIYVGTHGYMYAYVHMRGGPKLISGIMIITSYYSLRQDRSVKPRVKGWVWLVLLARGSRDPTVSTSPVLGLQTCAAVPSFSHGFWGSKLDLYS